MGKTGKREKNQSHSLQNLSDLDFLAATDNQLYSMLDKQLRWKQVVNISFSTALGQASLPKLTLAITGYKWQSVNFRPVTLLLLLQLLLHHLFSSHQKLELWFQETCILFNHYMKSFHSPIPFSLILIQFPQCWCKIPYSYSQVRLLLAKEHLFQ